MDLRRQGNELRRHDDSQVINSDLNPIEDLINLISSLKSRGFTSGLLHEVYNYSDSSEIKKTSKLISYHAYNAISLAEQAFEASAETSFLPLYYSTLNLSKVLLLIRGYRHELEKNRWHGASYKEDEMRKHFLNEKIFIRKSGSIPLLYKALIGKKITNKVLPIKLEEIYKNITTISAEYSMITNRQTGMLAFKIMIIKDDDQGHCLKIIPLDTRFESQLPSPRKLPAFTNLKIVTDDNGKKFFETKRIKGEFEDVKKRLIKFVNRNLISDRFVDHDMINYWIGYTPISGNEHVFNEDISILLAYFHFSNIVRYNPEHLYKLMDSKYWPIMLSLRKHGYLRYQKLMWGNYLKKSFDIS